MAKEYIEREKLMEILDRNFYGQGGAVVMKQLIEAQPAADVTPVRHGKWEWFEEWSESTSDHLGECDDCGWRCGRCKDALEDMVGGYWDDPTEKPRLSYCPNCGAKMDIEK